MAGRQTRSGLSTCLEPNAGWKHRRPPAPSPRPRPKPRRRFPPEVLSDAEVRALMDACGRYTPNAIRNRALIAVLYRSGLRISEALDLYPKDIDSDRGAIRVLHGKGGKSRVSGIDVGGLAVLQRWLDKRAGMGLNGLHPVFCTRSGRKLAGGCVRRWLPRLGRKAGIAKRVHAHGLRHTHAAELRSEGIDIGIISKQLGHTSIATTARYLDHIAPVAVVEAIRHRAWVIRSTSATGSQASSPSPGTVPVINIAP